MDINERLTEAARAGAQGKTTAGGYQSLPADKQQALLEYVMSGPKLVEEIVRTSLLAMPLDELEDLLNSMGTSREQTLHTSEKTTLGSESTFRLPGDDD